MKNLSKLLFVLLILSNVCLITLALDVSELGDFSSRSLLMRGLNDSSNITQDQKDLLKSKKLTPTTECLFKQIKKGKVDNVILLLDANVNPNKSYYSDYPIYYAARNNKPEIVKLLFERGAKLDRGFYSELYEAVRNKDNDLTWFLINNGAKVNYMDSISGNTIVYVALKNKMYDVAKVLIKKGAKADSKSLRYIQKKKLGYLIKED